MKEFAELYRALDAATATKRKLAAMESYFAAAIGDETRRADAAWTAYFLSGGKPRQIAPAKALRALVLAQTGLPEWLFDQCRQRTGDLAETLSLLLPPAQGEEELPLHRWMSERLLPLRGKSDDEKIAALSQWLSRLPDDERFVLFKIITGSLRVGVSKSQATQALAQASGVDPQQMAMRMMGFAQSERAPQARDFERLTAQEPQEASAGAQPYPFYLAHSLQAPLNEIAQQLGDPRDWQIEWKFDGIRAQYVQRNGKAALWSRGEELITESWPEFAHLQRWLPDGTVIDGELVVTDGADVSGDDLSGLQPFSVLQRRLGRKQITPKILREWPAALIAYDLLESEGRDLRQMPQHERRAALERLIGATRARAHDFGDRALLRLSPLVQADDWAALDALRGRAREFFAEGFMLKSRNGIYGAGRRKAADGASVWHKWKLDPYSVDAVLVYAQRGHGRRSGVFSDYTFAVWDRPAGQKDRTLVPFAKAYSGLTDAEMREVDRIIRATTRETFGPVRQVAPAMVFELGFEGIGPSQRHKSGVAVRFPRMLRWRKDKPVEEADTIEVLQALIAS
ncbi:MAG: ATP-dependent DNA ligase [Hyphomicrobiales bacterium]|nr:ATP-dependent DNA ligase [Hyphomicrobiales bacterium]